MKKMKLTALLLALCMLLSGCGGTPAGDASSAPSKSGGASAPPSAEGAEKLSGSIEIGVMLAEGTSGYNFITGVGDQLIAENPDLQITYTFVNTKARPFIEQRWRAGNPPDTDYYDFNAQVPSTYEFAEHLLDLTPYLDADPEWRDSFQESVSAVTTMDGKTYGVVTDTHVLGLYYNKAYFDQFGIDPPKTWDDLLAACETLKANGIDPIAITGTYTPYMGTWLDYLMTREVGYTTAYNTIRDGNMSEIPGLLRAAEKVKTLVDNGYLLKGFEGTDFTAAQMQFFQGKAGMICMGTWLSSEMADSIPADFQLGFCAFPSVSTGEGDQTEILSHSNIMSINKDSKNLDAVLAFVKLFTSAEVQTRRAQETGLISAVKGVPAPAGTFGLDETIANAGPMRVRHFSMEFESDRNTAYYNEVAKLFMGEYTPEQFIAGVDQAMQAFK